MKCRHSSLGLQANMLEPFEGSECNNEAFVANYEASVAIYEAPEANYEAPEAALPASACQLCGLWQHPYLSSPLPSLSSHPLCVSFLRQQPRGVKTIKVIFPFFQFIYNQI